MFSRNKLPQGSAPQVEVNLEDRVKLFIPLLIIIPALLVLFLTFVFAEKQLESSAESSLIDIGSKLMSKVENYLHPASISVDINASLLESVYGQDGMARGFHDMAKREIAHYPHLGLIYFGDTKGNHWLNKNETNDIVSLRIIKRLDDSPESWQALGKAKTMLKESPIPSKKIAALIAPFLYTSWHEVDAQGELSFTHADPIKVYDPRLRPWYTGVESVPHKQFWTDVYTWENKSKGIVTMKAGITVSAPVLIDGELVGVTAIDLLLESISKFLKNLKISPNGRAFLFDSQGKVVGLPNFSEMLVVSDNAKKSIKRVHISAVKDRAKADAFAALQKSLKIQKANPAKNCAEMVINFASMQENFFAYFQPLSSKYPLDWCMGVLIPEEDIKGPLKEQFSWILIAIVIVVLLLISMLPFYLKSERDRRFIRGAFSKYVSPNRVEFLLENPENLALGGEYRNCSFVMTDLEDFTSMMEQIGDRADPALIVNTLNEYLEGMVQIAFRHEGTLDRIVGDAVAVLFSAPLQQNDHAKRAMECAVEMDIFASGFAKKLNLQEIPFGRTRIGINTGQVLLGNFGGKTVFDYRALGDPVNTAARLESVNKQIGTQICVSSTTVEQLDSFTGRPVGNLLLKGKGLGTKAFEPIPAEEMGSDRIKSYLQAYDLMQAQNPGAKVLFARGVEKWPEDPLFRFHLERLLRGELGETVVFNHK